MTKRFLPSLLLMLFLLGCWVDAWTEEPVNRYLYISSPDAAQESHRPGIYVFDIDKGHEFVKFISVPEFKGGLRGFCPSLANKSAYYSRHDGTLGRFDLESEEVVWEKKYEFGVDRSCISRDGKKLYAPFGFWHRRADGGFYVFDLERGKELYSVREEPRTARRPHGVGLTPDETEIWISDQYGNRLLVYDNTVLPEKKPTLKDEIELTQGGHGWVNFSLDGTYAWCHTPDVIDVKRKKIVATLRDGEGNRISGSKFFEAHFRGGELVRVGSEFGKGRAHVNEGTGDETPAPDRQRK